MSPHQEFELSVETPGCLRVLLAVGALSALLGLVLAPARTWPMLLLASYALMGFGLAGVVFIAIQYVAGGHWSVAIRRIPEAMTAALPVGGIGLLAVVLLRPSLYAWSSHLPEPAEGWLGFKHAWLSYPFFLARTLVYLLVWTAFARAIVRASRQQDSTGDPALTHRNARLSAAFLVIFGLTFWLASFDWVMSLEPEWYSTIFGIYNFSGMFLGGLAAMAVLVVWLEKAGPLAGVVGPQHRLDLGRLIFAFSTFWMYIWFSQYMLIWYANFPEETSYFIARRGPYWTTLFVLNVFLNWVIPFFVLTPRANKQNPRVLTSASAVILLGRALDLFLMFMPPFAGNEFAFGIWEAGILLGAFALFLHVFLRAARQAPTVPVGDPFLYESFQEHG